MNFFSRWKIILKKYVLGIFEISENFWKFSKFYKDSSQKLIFQILTFVKNPYRILRNFQKYKKIQEVIFWEKCFISKKYLEFFLNTYVNVEFSVDSKNRT